MADVFGAPAQYANDPSTIPSGVPEELRLDMGDADILRIVQQKEAEAREYNSMLLKRNQDNEAYWKGDQLNTTTQYAWRDQTVQNHVFMATETVVPIVISENPEVAVFPAQQTPEAEKIADKLQKMCRYHWDRLFMQDKMAVFARHLVIYRFAVIKFFWDYLKDDIGTIIVNPKQIKLDPAATGPEDARYLFHEYEVDRDELTRRYPDKAAELPTGTVDNNGTVPDDKQQLKSVVRVTEFWSPEYTCTYVGSTVLEKKRNPFYDWVGEAPNEGLVGEGEGAAERAFYNYWDAPRMPFVVRTVFTTGDHLAGDTTLLEQARPMQDSINERKRQIETNAKITANGWTLVDSSVMSQEDARRITNEPGLTIVGPGVAEQGKLRRESGSPLPAFVMEDLMHSQAAFDNLFGTHGTTRGERGAQETATGRAILRQADLGRIELIVRVMESAITELSRGWVQCMRLFYTEQHAVKLLGREGGYEYLTLSRDEIEDGIEVMVKAGSLMPQDKVGFRNEAIELWQMGAIDPVTFFERLNYPNPKDTAERLVLWKQGLLEGMPVPQPGPQTLPGGEPIPPEVQEQLAAAQQAA